MGVNGARAGRSFFDRHDNIYVYIPNLIGYFRLLCYLFAFVVALDRPALCASAYFLGFVCDAFDGWCARKFHQTSVLGAVLDMVTDRLATTGLLVVVSTLHRGLYAYCLGLLLLDIFSHWAEMYYTLAMGAKSHKDIKSSFWMLEVYYRSRMFMCACCLSCEVLYILMYLLHWKDYQWLLGVLRLPNTMLNLAGIPGSDIEGSPIACLLALVCLVLVLAKQVVNVAQLGVSLHGMVLFDLKSRKQVSQ
eukprot:evm.model.scf_2008.1 EVM.evm.TU.scf_2008.1   scf_2008:5743-8621(-)